MAPMSFKQFVNVDYANGGDEQLAYNAQKRKKESVETQDEALDITQRRKLSQRMKRMKSRIAMGRKRASRKVASMDKLKIRARKQARNQIIKKLTKDIPKSELSNARKKDIEKRLERPAIQNRIARIAKKSLPQVRKAELEKKRGGGAKKDAN